MLPKSMKSATKNMLGNYECLKCDYICSKKSLWKQHVLTLKHIRQHSATHHKNPENKFICDICGKEYKQRSGLWRHKKICKKEEEEKSMMNKMMKTIENDSIMKNKMLEQMEKQNKIIEDLIPKIGNRQININLFLNKCSDAINMTDFIQTLHSNEPLQKTINISDSISNLLLNQLSQMDIYTRPIHCTDLKKEIIYVKDNDHWSEDTEKMKTKSLIHSMAKKHRNASNDDEYVDLIHSLTNNKSNSSSERKIMKKLTKEININEEIK